MEDSTTQSLEESIKNVVIEEPAAAAVVSSEVSEIKCDSVSDAKGVDAGEIKHVDVAEAQEKLGSSEELELEQEPGEEEKKTGSEEDVAKEGNKDSDSDSEDDLQVIVNDEDIFGPPPEGGEEAEGEEMFTEEHYEDVDWAAEMHYHHSQFYKYVRPGSGPEDPPQAPASAPPGAFTPGYGMGMWGYPFAYEFVLPASQTIFDVDLEQFEDKPWVYPGVDISDYFNFGFTEETWKQYCEELARVREEANKMRDDDNDQGWAYDNGGYNESSEPQKGRGRMRNNNFSGRGDGGGLERRGSGDGRRHRRQSVIQIPSEDGISHGRHEGHGEFRRNHRNDDMQRRKSFSSVEQSTPLSGRLSRAPGPFSQSPGGMLSSPSARGGMYTPRSRISSPGRMQGSFSNGSRRHSSETSSRPWRTSSRRSDEVYDEDERSYGSSGQSDSGGDSDRNESEDEYTKYRNHRLRRFSSQPLESRLGGRIEISRDRDPEPVPEKRTVKLSRHARDEEEDEEEEKLPEPSSRRYSEKLERSSASAQVVTQRRSSELVTERRSSLKRLDQAVRETISTQVTEVKTTVERRLTPVRRVQPGGEPEVKQPEKKLQSISERRAQIIAERKLQAEKREREAKVEKHERVSSAPEKLAEHSERVEVKVNPVRSRERERDRERERERERASSVVERRLLKPALRAAQQPVMKPASSSSSRMRAAEQGAPKQDNGDLRLKVLERVSARWKFHLRMDDEHAKKKRENLIKPAHQKEVSNEDEVEDSGVKRRLSRRQYDEVYEEQVEEYDEEAGDEERWEVKNSGGAGVLDRKRKRKERDEEWEYGDEAVEGFVSRKTYPRQVSSRARRYQDHDAGLEDAWEIEEGECEEIEEEDRWNEYEEQEPVYNRRKRRKFDYGVYKDSDEVEGYEYDGGGLEDARRGDFFYDGSTSSGQGEEMFYRKRGVKSYSRESDRWTGTLDDSGEEYDE